MKASHVFQYPTQAATPNEVSQPAWIKSLRTLETINRSFDWEDDFTFDLDVIAERAQRVHDEEFA